jgi:hypothetical protein
VSSHTDALRLHEHITRGLVWLERARRDPRPESSLDMARAQLLEALRLASRLTNDDSSLHNPSRGEGTR